MKRIATACFSLLLLAAMACAQVPKEYQPTQLRDFPRGSLTIERAKGRDTLHVWIADTQSRKEQGFMWIRDLPAGYGMVFPLDPPREFNLWMKNTYVSLDMLFYDGRGRITHIAERATPLSEDIIPSGGVVAGVVEILAGEVARRGIRIGDRLVIHGPGK
jgi:uncharacterized protein